MAQLKSAHQHVFNFWLLFWYCFSQDGQFGADMQVHIQNDGPVTLFIEPNLPPAKVVCYEEIMMSCVTDSMMETTSTCLLKLYSSMHVVCMILEGMGRNVSLIPRMGSQQSESCLNEVARKSTSWMWLSPQSLIEHINWYCFSIWSMCVLVLYTAHLWSSGSWQYEAVI